MADILNTVKNFNKADKDAIKVKVDQKNLKNKRIDTIPDPTVAMIKAVKDLYLAGTEDPKVIRRTVRNAQNLKMSKAQVVQILKTMDAVAIVAADPVNYVLSEDGTEAIYIGTTPEV